MTDDHRAINPALDDLVQLLKADLTTHLQQQRLTRWTVVKRPHGSSTVELRRTDSIKKLLRAGSVNADPRPTSTRRGTR